jgi:hypothetical protein
VQKEFPMRYAIAALSILGLTACGVGQPTCAKQAAPQLVALQGIARAWDDAFAVANSTPSSALSAQIAMLQSTRRKAQGLAMPECASSAKRALVDAMDSTINGFIAFLGKKSESKVKVFFTRANERMKAFGEASALLSATPVP